MFAGQGTVCAFLGLTFYKGSRKPSSVLLSPGFDFLLQKVACKMRRLSVLFQGCVNSAHMYPLSEGLWYDATDPMGC